MKYFASAIFLFFILWQTTAAQTNGKFEEWGKVSLGDYNTTTCSFDKNPDLILLLDLADVSYSKNNLGMFSTERLTITTSYYQRFKVITQKGAQRANFTMKYPIKSGDKITDIKGRCYNLGTDGKLVSVDLAPADIHETQANEYEMEISFSIPGVKEGSVFELMHQRHQIVNYTLPTWYFTSDGPSLKSRLVVNFLDAIEYYQDLRIHSKQFKRETNFFVSDIEVPSGYSYEKLKGTKVTYTALNLPAIHDEPYMNSQSNYVDRIAFQLRGYYHPFTTPVTLVTSWSDYVTNLLNRPDFGGSLIRNSPVPKKQWKSLLNERMTDKEKGEAIFDFVRQSMQATGAISLIPHDALNDVWRHKTGTSGEINMLLISALRDAGLKAYPMVVSGRRLGYLNKDYPMMENLRSLVVMLECDSEKIVLDATDKFLPFGVIKYDLLNNYGFVIVNYNKYYFYDMFNKGTNSESTFITAEIDAGGNMTGECQSVFDNYAAASCHRLKAGSKDGSLKDFVQKRMPNSTITSIQDTIDNKGKAYTQKVEFSHQVIRDNEGNLYVSMADVYGTALNPFVDDTRISDVDFGYKQKEYRVLQISIPENYTVDSLIRPTMLITSDSSISLLFDAEVLGDVVQIREKLQYNKSLYPVDRYAEFYEFHQQYFKLIQQPVIFRRKT